MTLKNAMAALCLKPSSHFVKVLQFTFVMLVSMFFLKLDFVVAQNSNKIVGPLKIGNRIPEEFWSKEFLFYVNGDTVRKNLSEYKGKLLVLDYWMLKCPYCYNRMKEMELAFAKYPKNANLVYVNPPSTKNKFSDILASQDKYEEFSLNGSFESVIESSYLEKLFPGYSYPNFIWISPRGYFFSRGTSLFVNDFMIEKILQAHELTLE